jgi:ATP-dependent helicase HrpB
LNNLFSMMPKLDLPIFEIEQRLLDALKTQKRLVLTAPPVQASQPKVPQMLLDSGFLRAGQVTVLQPRRLPTRMLAAWVARFAALNSAPK